MLWLAEVQACSAGGGKAINHSAFGAAVGFASVGSECRGVRRKFRQESKFNDRRKFSSTGTRGYDPLKWNLK